MVSCLIGAPASGSGKTVLTMGMVAALKARGHPITPAKVGPDYIDTAFLSAAAGRPAINLDLWAMQPELFGRLAAAQNLVVEGVMGLFDGPSAGVGSSADVARALNLPVVLVVNAERMSHSVAALVHGFMSFDETVRVVGVILTKVGSGRHEAMLRHALSSRGIPCLGALPRDEALSFPSRHLGLQQARERGDLFERIAAVAAQVEAHCDLDRLIALADENAHADTESLPSPLASERSSAIPWQAGLPPLGQRIALAEDDAFSFFYEHLIRGWRDSGASVHRFSPLNGDAPDPSADAVYLPGGYPELFAGRLAATKGWITGLRTLAEKGVRIYGECGGYMALGETLIDGQGEAHRMAGLLPITTNFRQPRRTLGYRELTHDGAFLEEWPQVLRGHEFHYATIGAEGPPLFGGSDAQGTDLGPMGTQIGSVAGSFAHVIDGARTHSAPS
ncbi:MAG: cobyrinate a,c-diamide synthase [Pseudomonadota bacterium]